MATEREESRRGNESEPNRFINGGLADSRVFPRVSACNTRVMHRHVAHTLRYVWRNIHAGAGFLVQ